MPQTEQEVRVLIEKAVDLLEKIVMDSELPLDTRVLPRREIIHAKALIFVFTSKIALGATIFTGEGFIISQVPETKEWSAPLFIRIRSGGVGLAFGTTTVKSVATVRTDDALKSLLTRQIGLRMDFGMQLGLGTKGSEAPPATFGNPSIIKDIETYSIKEGTIVDISIQGMGFSPDKEALSALYGHDVDGAQVLSGKISPPAGSESIYKALEKVGKDYKEELVAHGQSKRMLAGEDPQLKLF